MGKFFKRIFQIFAVVIFLIIAVFSVQVYSDKLSTHRVSLQCSWTENSQNARDKISWPDDVQHTVQIRNDWINNTLMSYSIAPGVEGGVKEEYVREDVDRYWSVEHHNTFKATTEYNRETLMHRMTVEWNNGTTAWVGGPCEVITASDFADQKQKAIAQLKAKQKI